MLDQDMQRVIAEQRLGYVASVCPDGTANLSPKGTVAVWDERHLVFAHIHSHQTIANIEAGHDVVEVNVVDPIRRRGYRFKGSAEVHREGEPYRAGIEFFQRRSRRDERRIRAIVLIRVDRAAALFSPSYDDGASEHEIEERFLALYGLRRTNVPGGHGTATHAMQIVGIDHVQVAGPPGCEPQARAFYGELLGMAEVPKPETLSNRAGCWFRAGAQELHVGTEDPFSPARKAHPSLIVSDLAALMTRLRAAGSDPRHDDTLAGVVRCHVTDPFGNRLELRQAGTRGD